MFQRVIAGEDRDIDWLNHRRSVTEHLLADLSYFRKEVQALVGVQRDLFKLRPYVLGD